MHCWSTESQKELRSCSKDHTQETLMQCNCVCMRGQALRPRTWSSKESKSIGNPSLFAMSLHLAIHYHLLQHPRSSLSEKKKEYQRVPAPFQYTHSMAPINFVAQDCSSGDPWRPAGQHKGALGLVAVWPNVQCAALIHPGQEQSRPAISERSIVFMGFNVSLGQNTLRGVMMIRSAAHRSEGWHPGSTVRGGHGRRRSSMTRITSGSGSVARLGIRRLLRGY